jgi:CRISPR-associated endonuclease Csn1
MAIKTILGLDLGTNSIGWSLIKTNFEKKEGNIEGLGSRIIPMSQDIMGKFDSGVSISQTAERTGYRGVRRLYQRGNLRRERLHRILNVLNFLPEHYSKEIDFEKRLGQFKKGKEPKLNYRKNDSGNYEFLFMDSFIEMVKEFESRNQDTKIPYDWTLYFLRKKALTQKILKEELAWILLNFNQKRGYYQLRGEEEEIDKTKLEEFYSLKVKEVQETEDKNAKGTWYNIILENDWVYRRQSKEPLDKWIGKHKDFIVTTQLEKDGNLKLDKEGNVKRSFRSPKEDDWGLVKTKTQKSIDTFNAGYNTVGTAHYILDKLLTDPKQKIRGKLVKTIERKYYKEELEAILSKQIELHDDLNNKKLYSVCIEELYPRNEAHKKNIADRGFDYLFIKDVIFYQRPLKSKKSTISNCQFETRYFNHMESGERRDTPLKGISKSHPLFQEFRLLQWFKFFKIYQKEDGNGNLIDKNVTYELLPDLESRTTFFDFLKTKKEVEQKHIIQFFITNKKIAKKDKENYQWNYMDKPYPCFNTKASIVSRLSKVNSTVELTDDFVIRLWHIIYSIKDKNEFKQALKSFAKKNDLDENSFVNAFEKYPPFDNNYSAFSEKAIKKLLPLMRFGTSWNQSDINEETKERIDKILTGEVDENIQIRVRELISKDNRAFTAISDFNDLQLHLASYIVYNRHSEIGDVQKWSIPADIDKYLREFKQHSLRNPIVEQVVTETLRTVRDIWKYYGKGKENFFSEIHVELGREMKNPADKRKQISARNSENENTNIRIKAILQELINDGARSYSPSHQEILKIYEEGIYENSPDEYNQVKLEDIDKIRKQSAPSQSDINKYKLWLEQGYISPYTGEPIPLSDLFTEKYQIEHIIPQSRYFDNSLSNKIICESEVNQLKDNKTAYEFIKNPKMNIVDLGQGKSVRLYSLEQYESHCNKYFKRNRTKLKKLLSKDIPDGFIERQLNDSRYISKLIKGLLSNIVREDGEQEATSKNVVPVTGAITSKLKRDWGLNDKWNELVAPRFERLNELTNSNDYGYWDDKINAFRTQVPDEISKGFNKKRIDHRHHGLDALVIACCTKDHTNYITSLNTNRKNFSLVSKLRETEEIEKDGKKRTVAKAYHKPWLGFTMDAKDKLDKTIISFKKNTRIINKTNNKTWQWVDDNGQLKKKLVKQTKGDNWAIRKPMHKETVSGLVELKRKKKGLVTLNKAIEDVLLVVDKTIRQKIKSAFELFDNDTKQVKGHFKKHPILIDGTEVKKVEMHELINATATRTYLSDKFTRKQLESITDTGIQKILENHVKNFREDGKERFDLAFNPEGVDELNKNIKQLNNGKNHQPIRKVRIYEVGNKFSISENQESPKSKKYVEAAKGTNLFFAIYWDAEKKKRVFETIPLNEVIEHQKQRATLSKNQLDMTPMIPVNHEEGEFLFSLSPNDLVYVPTDEEIENVSDLDSNNLSKTQVERVYKMVSTTQGECHFVPAYYSAPIRKNEMGTNNKSQNIITNEAQVKSCCWKLKVDRLGNVEGVIK